MKNMRKKFMSRFAGKNGLKSLVISIVILVELVAIASVATFAWVETVSSIKIATRNAQNEEDPLVVDSFVFTEAMIGEGKGTIDLADYFKKSGDMHLSPVSSADGENMYFPKLNSNSTAYMAGGTAGSFRKGDFSDKNTTYMSVSFKLKADVNADFFFTQAPTFSKQGDNIRVSVTAYTEGMTKGDLYDTSGKPLYTKIYANSDSAANTKVVGNTSGTTVDTSYEAFGDHIKGKGSTAKLFSVAADETKIVTINLWLQGSSINNSLPQDISISNFGIISDLTPRHVTLIPTDRWDLSDKTEYFYAWCWDSSKSGVEDRLYKLELDENEHYSFDYNGTYQKTLFIRCGNPNLTTNDMKSSWSTLGLWNKTADTAIPDTPVDPTYVIKTISGGEYDSDISGNQSTGLWSLPDIVTIKTAYVTNQSSSCGTLTSASYYGTTVTSTEQVEANNSTNANAKHHDTIHAMPGKKVRLTASANTDYAFVGWYDNAAGTGEALSTSTTYDFNATTDAPREITYYAKFKGVRTIKINKILEGNASSTAEVGSMTITNNDDGTSITESDGSVSKTVDYGSSVSLSASPGTGYELSGIYTTASTGGSEINHEFDANVSQTYYARFTYKSFDVTARAYYSTNNGTSYTAGNTGGTVTAGSSAAGATSTASVKYKSSVTLVATPASGYEFVGWYSAATGGSQLSTNTSYSYTLSTTGAKNVYARFIGEIWSLKYGVSGASSWNSKDMTVNGNTITGSLTLTEGQDFSFQIVKTIGSTDTWYGGGGTYQNITSTSFISNKTLSVGGGDIYIKGHAGTYTFTFNKSTNVLNVTASYSNITITLIDNTSNKWLDDGDAIFYLDCSGYSGIKMTKGTNQWTASIPSNTRITNITFKRNNPENTTTWNSWTWADRGYSTSYTVN